MKGWRLRLRTVRFLGAASLGVCLWITLGSSSSSMASPRVPQICDQADSGERIKCKFDNVIGQQQGVVDMVGQMNLLPPSAQNALTQEVGRAERAQGRAPALEFKQLTKKSKVTCQIKELIGDGDGDDDGICRPNEDCEEVLNDQIGNDDGVCHPRNGANREVCVEICDDDAINADPSNFDDDPTANSRGRDLEETLDGLTAQYEEIAVMMDAELYARESADAPTDGADGPCDAVQRSRPSSVLLAVLVGAAEGSRVAADIAERLCDQAAFGFSGSSACVVIEGVAGAAKVIATAVAVEGEDIDSNTIDSTFACLKVTNETAGAAAGAVDQVSDDLADVSQQIDDVDDRVGVVDEKVELLQQQLAEAQQAIAQAIHLLQLPAGQREGFPDGTSEPELEPAPLTP